MLKKPCDDSDDGIAIDWESERPVMSDILDSPPAAVPSSEKAARAAPEAVAGTQARPPQSSPSAGPTQKQHTTGPLPAGATAGQRPTTGWTPPNTGGVTIPALGQTLWRVVSPPPPRHNEAVVEPTSHTSATAGSTTSRYAAKSAGTGTSNATNRTAVVHASPEVEIIDLTLEDNDDADDEDQHERFISMRLRPRHVPSRRATLRSHHSQLPKPASLATAHEVLNLTLDDEAPPSQVRASPDVVQANALKFIQRYFYDFSLDRSKLEHAYSHSATFSVQHLPPPTPPAHAVASKHNNSTSPVYPPAAHVRGRAAIISALNALPDGELLCAASADGSGDALWDFVYAPDAGDALLVCHTTAMAPVPAPASRGSSSNSDRPEAQADGHGSGRTGKGVGMGSGAEPLMRKHSCVQRFVLRPKEWDEQDRATPGMWPTLAVAHHILFRPLEA
ncbi:hypothetical protein BD413DRAFT_236483 [Trametes elegans]|nr:hypothetical protein BD413DRAFT_236483 [Trametes elegans]